MHRNKVDSAIEITATGQSKPVTMIEHVTWRKRLRDLLQLVNKRDANAFIIVDDERQVFRDYGRIAK